MALRVVVRKDNRLADGAQLLLRMNDDREVGTALKLALANAPAYRAVPGFERSGALAISCFAVADEIDAGVVVRNTRWSVYGLARVADLRALGCQVIATDVFDGDELLPLSKRHVDLLVCACPGHRHRSGRHPRARRSRLRPRPRLNLRPGCLQRRHRICSN